MNDLSAASEIQAGFLNLGAIDILGWIMVCGGGGGGVSARTLVVFVLSVHCRVLSIIPGLYPLDTT